MTAVGDYTRGGWLLLNRGVSLLAEGPRYQSRAKLLRTTFDPAAAAQFDEATARHMASTNTSLCAVPLTDPRETVRCFKGDLYCACDNVPMLAGFHPCTEDGTEVEPIAGEWPRPLYLCGECRRIIEHPGGDVTGPATVTGYAHWQ